jgi:hypothetical protein
VEELLASELSLLGMLAEAIYKELDGNINIYFS